MPAIEARLRELGILLPEPPAPVASYVPFTVSGNIVYLSGQLPIANGAVKYSGKLGADIPLESGQAAAQLCAINLIAQLRVACGGDLDRVVRCLKLGVFVNAMPDYKQHPEVANGASDLIAAVFGEAGKHARAAVGVGSLPRGAAVEADAVFENTVSGDTARLAAGAAEIGAARWNALANPGRIAEPHPFTTFEFFHALEASGSACAQTGWQPVHLMIGDGALMPLYLKGHSQGEYVFDHGWADALERAGGDYYPKLQCAVPFTPVTGQRLFGDVQSLLRTAAGAVRQIGASSLHLTFLTRAEWEAAGAAGYLQRTGQQFHWENPGYGSFDEFLGELSSAKRKNLRKERAAVAAAGVTFDWLTGADITEAHWDQFFEFYMDTGGRKWGMPYLTREFFSRLGDGLRHQTLLIMARKDGRYIAGALNLFGEWVLFGRNWGAIEYVPFLHFETCYYQAIDFAIARGLKRVEAGAQGEHKLLRGYLPVPTYSAHFMAHKGLQRAVGEFLEAERVAVAENIAELAQYAPFRKKED